MLFLLRPKAQFIHQRKQAYNFLDCYRHIAEEDRYSSNNNKLWQTVTPSVSEASIRTKTVQPFGYNGYCEQQKEMNKINLQGISTDSRQYIGQTVSLF